MTSALPDRLLRTSRTRPGTSSRRCRRFPGNWWMGPRGFGGAAQSFRIDCNPASPLFNRGDRARLSEAERQRVRQERWRRQREESLHAACLAQGRPNVRLIIARRSRRDLRRQPARSTAFGAALQPGSGRSASNSATQPVGRGHAAGPANRLQPHSHRAWVTKNVPRARRPAMHFMMRFAACAPGVSAIGTYSG